MKRRNGWRPVPDQEIKRWSQKSYEQLRAELCDIQDYEIEFESKAYQVEIELLENTPGYVP